MITRSIQYLSEKEEELVGVLMRIGMQKNVAKMLVYLAGTSEATSREIERGADMRQPEVSMAAKSLDERGWIRKREGTISKKGRPLWNYSLAVPIDEIMDSIEKDKKKEFDNKIRLLKRLQKMV